jgi:hypothetical protein
MAGFKVDMRGYSYIVQGRRSAHVMRYAFFSIREHGIFKTHGKLFTIFSQGSKEALV